MLKGKIHRATVTDANLEYVGSISIDQDLLECAGLLEYEQVDVYNIANGARFTTYTILAPRGSGEICINGAAAHLANPGDLVIICSYGRMELEEAKGHKPVEVFVDAKNKVVVHERTAA
jgi:aspartate 1-decarboxylase